MLLFWIKLPFVPHQAFKFCQSILLAAGILTKQLSRYRFCMSNYFLAAQKLNGNFTVRSLRLKWILCACLIVMQEKRQLTYDLMRRETIVKHHIVMAENLCFQNYRLPQNV
ncbi:hypothetical protein EO93_03375 [Methanosarcina sp. 1.H.A.2.2]|nr:hypothetical protein EO93_03375 [Methanosarcina sp. 1.H.A.2.2]